MVTSRRGRRRVSAAPQQVRCAGRRALPARLVVRRLETSLRHLSSPYIAPFSMLREYIPSRNASQTAVCTRGCMASEMFIFAWRFTCKLTLFSGRRCWDRTSDLCRVDVRRSPKGRLIILRDRLYACAPRLRCCASPSACIMPPAHKG